jgi:mono/diheme cytochrome c family protein
VRISHVVTGALLLCGGLAFAQTSAPQMPAAQTSAPQTQNIAGNIEHGRYLVHDVAMCPQCHTPRDEAGDLIESKLFDGGPIPFRPPWPNDWALLAPRSKGLPGYDDAAAMRLLTQGAIGRDGKQLKPPMPRFHMTKQDASDVIAYMRSLR